MSKDARGRRARRQFSEEFKEGAVRLVLDGLWVRQARAERTKGKSVLRTISWGGANASVGSAPFD